MEGERTGLTVVTKGIATTNTPGNTSTVLRGGSVGRLAETPSLLKAQLGRACVPGRGPAFKKETRSVGMSTVPADPKDMETQKAQEKLRHIESLGIIKIEKDEPLEEDQNSESATAVVPAIPTPVCEASVHPNSQGMGVSQPIMNPASTSLPSFTDSPGPRFLIVAPQQQGQVSTVLELQSQATTVSGVVDVPILTNMEGEYGFTVSIQDRERTTKSPMWLMSKITKKLYTNINKAVPFEINLKKRVINEHFFIRAVPVFSSPQFLRTNVNRCPNHASPTDPTNHDFPYPEHVVRADHPGARYDNTNGRLSVRVPLDILQDGSGSDYTPVLLRFMCLGSCVGGINRRPIAIILTLENGSGHVVGRKVVDVRVCACPTRDIRTDENAAQNKGKRKCSAMPLSPHLTKKKFRAVEPKIEPKEESDETFTITVKNRKLYDLLMGVIEAYHKSHPEYADKNPESR